MGRPGVRVLSGSRRWLKRMLLDVLGFAHGLRDSSWPGNSEAGWLLLHLYPRWLLRMPGERRDLKPAKVQQRCHRFLDGDWAALHAEYLLSEASVAAVLRGDDLQLRLRPGRRAQPPTAEQIFERKAAVCIQRTRAGEAGRGNGTLQGDEVNWAGDEALLPALQGRFPAPPEESAADPVAAAAEAAAVLAAMQAFKPRRPIRLADSDTRAALLSASRKSAGGGSGVSMDLVGDAYLDSPALLSQLTGALQCAIEGDVPPTMARLMRSAVLIGLAKPAEPTVPRPICIGELLRRLPGRMLGTGLVDGIRATLLPHQLGTAVSGGTEAIPRAMQAMMDAHPDLLFIKLDASNAYNSLSRTAMFRALLACPALEGLVPFVAMLYSADGELLVKLGDGTSRVVWSRTGMYQGCPLSSLLYNLTTLAVLQWAATLCELVVAGHDDMFMAVRRDKAVELLNGVVARLAGLGVAVNVGKSVVLAARGRVPAEVAALGYACLDADTPPALLGFLAMGVPVSPRLQEYAGAFLAAWEAEVEQRTERIAVGLAQDAQVALTVLYQSELRTGTFLARVLPPALVMASLQWFDSCMVRCVERVVQLLAGGLGGLTLLQARLPQSAGGLGLTSIADAALAAHLASVIETAPLLAALRPDLAQLFTI